VSKYRHFLSLALISILLAGCTLIPPLPPTAGELNCRAEKNNLDSQLSQCQTKLQQKDQDIARLQEKLDLSQQANRQLEQEIQELQDALDTLTAIEHHLHQRRLKQSESP